MALNSNMQELPQKKRQRNFTKPSVRKTVLDPRLIDRFLTTDYIGAEIACFDVLESTNRSAKELARVGYPAGTIVACDHQMGGRGRRDRKWVSDPGESMLMSVILRPTVPAHVAPRYTIAAALGVYRAMAMYCMHNVRIKWPNDLVIGRKKLAGILLDCSASMDGINYLVVGIGLNVNTDKFYGDLSDRAVSIFQSTGVKVNRERVIANILNCSEPLFKKCETDEGFKELMEEYKRASAVYGKRVSIVKSTGTYEGTVTGFDDLGRIEMDCDTGEHRVFDSGDVSLRYDF